MATLKEIVDYFKTSDNTARVSIRVTHKRVPKFIPTEIYVTRKQVNKAGEIRDDEVIDDVRDIIKGYRSKINKLGSVADQYTCQELKEYLMRSEVTKVDFIKWASDFANGIKVKGSRENAWIVIRSFIDFVGESIDINEISLTTIKKYDDYLRTTRRVKRVNNPGKPPINMTLKPCTDTGVRDYMGKLKFWYVEAMKHYNDRGKVVIPYNPFDKYDAPDAVETPDKNLTPEQILELRDCCKVEVGKYKRTATTDLARDIAMLSFYLVGMNAVDLFQVDSYKDGRIRYDRAKTASRRKDNAHISIKVEPEAIPLIERYLDPTGERVFKFHLMYTHHDGLTKALNDGLKAIAAHLKWTQDISFIWIRHSWGSIARNDCNVPKDDVAEAMNHSDPDHKVTDIYIQKIWTRIDTANRQVLDYLGTISLLQIEEETKAVA